MVKPKEKEASKEVQSKKMVTSIKISPALWKLAKKQAIDKDMLFSEYLENLIEEDVRKSHPELLPK
jgi:hypothetical protein